jgi:hypothetical protein
MALLAALLAVVGARSADASAAKRCALPAGAKVERRTHSVLLYSRFLGDGGRRRHEFVACAAGLGTPHVVASYYAGDPLGGTTAIRMIRANGVFVAVASDSSDHYGSHRIQLRVFDARRGRSFKNVEVAGSPETYQPPNNPDLYGLVLADNGSFAFIARRQLQAPYDWRTVVVSEHRNSERLLDEGNAIATASLRLNGRTLSWIKAGERRSAQI